MHLSKAPDDTHYQNHSNLLYATSFVRQYFYGAIGVFSRGCSLPLTQRDVRGPHSSLTRVLIPSGGCLDLQLRETCDGYPIQDRDDHHHVSKSALSGAVVSGHPYVRDSTALLDDPFCV